MAMQLAAQLPHDDLGECLIIRDLVGNILRRWVMDERMMQHEARPEKEADGVIIRLQRAD